MEQRQLSDTEMMASRVCFGAMTFGSQVDLAAAERMVNCCLDRGVNFIDTANVYNGGESERILGRILKGQRGRVFLASKVGIRTADLPEEGGLSRTAITRAIENSLRRLETDYLDIYYLHQPDRQTPLEETMSAIEGLVREGKVRYIGASNYASWQVCRMLWLCEKNGYARVRVTQPMYNLLARAIESEFLPMCREFGIATAAYNPLAGGLLTGKHAGGEPTPGTRFGANKIYVDRYWNAANFRAVTRLADTARATGRSLVSLALNWLLHHTPVDYVILGASSEAQLNENLGALEDGPLSAEVTTTIDEIWKEVRGPSPQYNR